MVFLSYTWWFNQNVFSSCKLEEWASKQIASQKGTYLLSSVPDLADFHIHTRIFMFLYGYYQLLTRNFLLIWYLEFNVPWILDVLFQINSIISKSSCSLALSLLRTNLKPNSDKGMLEHDSFLFHLRLHIYTDSQVPQRERNIFVKNNAEHIFMEAWVYMTVLSQQNPLILKNAHGNYWVYLQHEQLEVPWH